MADGYSVEELNQQNGNWVRHYLVEPEYETKQFRLFWLFPISYKERLTSEEELRARARKLAGTLHGEGRIMEMHSYPGYGLRPERVVWRGGSWL